MSGTLKICNCSPMVLKFYVLLGHHTKLTHTKFCDKICHILRVMGKNECAKSGFILIQTRGVKFTIDVVFSLMNIIRPLHNVPILTHLTRLLLVYFHFVDTLSV